MRELPVELYRAAQVRELDRIAIAERGIPGYTFDEPGRRSGMPTVGPALAESAADRGGLRRRWQTTVAMATWWRDWPVKPGAMMWGAGGHRPGLHCAATRKPPGGMPAPPRS